MIAAIRIRGTVNVRHDITETMDKLRLQKPNHLALIREEKNLRKMVEKAKDYITFGEINEEILAALLEKRGYVEGGKKVTAEYLKEHKTDFSKLAKDLIAEKTALKTIGIIPVFRLHPPRKGHKRGGIKKAFTVGGALGYRAAEINSLIKSLM